MIHLSALATASVLHTGTTTTTVAKSTGLYNSILDPIAKPIAGLLAAIYSVIPNYGVAIMVLSVIWMIIISPLTLKSTRSMLAMQKLQPQLKRLQEQHKNDRQAFAQAQMDLFREHNVSPFGSCLPMLLPLPVFFALFRVIEGLSHTSKGPIEAIHCFAASCPTPQYLSTTTRMYNDIVGAHGQIHAFGMDLAKNALSPHSSALAAVPYWLILLVMAGTSYLQTAQMMNRNPAATQSNPQMRMMRYLPLLFVVFCIRFPAGVAVYYVMSNVCRILQQDFMYRFDPKVKTLVAKEVIEVEAITKEIDEQSRKGPGYTPPRSVREKTPAPSTGGSGRSRFRDLLAAAAEQQKTKESGRSGGGGGGSGGGRSGGGGGGAAGSGKGAKALGPGSGGSAGSTAGSGGSGRGAGSTGSGNGAARNGSGSNRPSSKSGSRSRQGGRNRKRRR